jgi:hypothetical protein
MMVYDRVYMACLYVWQEGCIMVRMVSQGLLTERRRQEVLLRRDARCRTALSALWLLQGSASLVAVWWLLGR